MSLDSVKFLLVDDLEGNLLALEGLLRREGLEILKAQSGAEALELLLIHDVDLALLDVQMPEMDGFELAELMRGTERTRRVPIIFVTAGATTEQRRFRGYEVGAVDFLFKPIDPHILRSKADVFFELACQRRQLQAAAENSARLLRERTEAEQNHRQLYDTMLQGAIYQNARGVITSMNPAAERILGKAREEFIGKTLEGMDRHVIREDGTPFPMLEHPSMVALRTGQPVKGVVMGIPALSGQIRRWISVDAVPIFRGGNPTPDQVYTVFDDITEQRKAEAALRESEERFRLSIEASPSAMLLADESGRVSLVNKEAERLFGYTRKELLGSLIESLIPERFPIKHLQAHATEDLKGTEVELIALRRDGTEVSIEIATSPKFVIGGCAAVLYAITDITERKRAESALRTAKEQAEEASRAKDHFLATLSHELRNPLNPVLLTATEILDDPSVTGEMRQAWNLVRKNVALETTLIDDLLDLTRIARGKMALQFSEINAHTVLRDALETVRPSIEEKRHALTLDFAAVQSVVRGDAVRLQQIFWNVLNNAVKFTPDGGSVTVRTRDAEGDMLVVEIADSGIGMTRDELASVFHAFTQGDHAESGGSHIFGGLGLGMAITRQLVEMHGGEICAKSAGRGCGSLFTISLPAVIVPSGVAGRVALESTHSADVERECRIRPLHVLVVEDHESTRATLARLLTRRGYEVTPAGTVAEARAFARERRFDVVVSDLGLPDGDGYSLMAELHDAQGTVLRGIALSGYGMPEDVERSMEAGFSAHLTKPVEMEVLEAVLRNLQS